MNDHHLKSHSDAPQGFFAAEAAGLKWLAEPGVIPVVEVIDSGEDHLRLERLEEVGSDANAAAVFDRRLARLHDSGAPGFGWSPSESAFFGPLYAPFAVANDAVSAFCDYWADQRLSPILTWLDGELTDDEKVTVTSAIEVIRSGAFDGICGDGVEAPARVHGDLWAGNLMWTPDGCTLIDPAAHGGHRLEDLALLALFGTPFLEEIFTGYEEVHPMPAGWREDLPVHSFFALLAHVRLFGRGFLAQTLGAARSITARARQLQA